MRGPALHGHRLGFSHRNIGWAGFSKGPPLHLSPPSPTPQREVQCFSGSDDLPTSGGERGGGALCSLGCTEGLQAAHCSFWAALTPAHRFPVPPVSGPEGMCQAGPWQPLEPVTAGHAEAVRAGGVSLSLRQHRFAIGTCLDPAHRACSLGKENFE